MKINKHFDYRTKTLKVSFEPEFFSEEELEEAKNDLIKAGASEASLNEDVDEILFENAYLDECENCSEKEEVYGTEEELNKDNFYAPNESDYLTEEEIQVDESEVIEIEVDGVWESLGAEYKGRKVKLNKPFRTPDGPKKFAVYTKNESGKVVIVRFGDPNMEIRRDDPERRRNFRARHNCDNPGPKYKARYWSCQWGWSPTKKVGA